MSSFSFDANKQRFGLMRGATDGILQSRNELETVQRHDSTIMVSGEDQSRRILHAIFRRFYIMERRKFDQIFILLWVVRVTIITSPGDAASKLVESQQIGNPNLKQK